MLDSPFNVIIVRHWYLHIEKAYPESQKAKKKSIAFWKVQHTWVYSITQNKEKKKKKPCKRI